MKTVRTKAYAKINLSLDVKGVEGGFHMIDSFVATTDLYDSVVAKKRKDGKIIVTMSGLDYEKIPLEGNNVEKAARSFSERFSCGGASISVFRNIPVGAGLGASSADVAGTLLALSKLYRKDSAKDFCLLEELANESGSDTAYLLRGGFKRLLGRGERIEPLPPYEKKKLYFLAICPETGVSAGECYRAFDELKKTYVPSTQACIDAFVAGDLETLGKHLSNRLADAAFSLNPDAERALFEAKSFSPLGATLTGSGSAAIALFDSREMAEWAKSRYRGRFRTFVLETIDSDGIL